MGQAGHGLGRGVQKCVRVDHGLGRVHGNSPLVQVQDSMPEWLEHKI